MQSGASMYHYIIVAAIIHSQNRAEYSLKA